MGQSIIYGYVCFPGRIVHSLSVHNYHRFGMLIIILNDCTFGSNSVVSAILPSHAVVGRFVFIADSHQAVAPSKYTAGFP